MILLTFVNTVCSPNPNSIATIGLACFPFARRYLGNRCFFLFLRLLRCFSSAGSPPMTILFTIGWPVITLAGFPHSEICGSTRICHSPQLIAAYHVLLRLLMPRHPSCALSSLTLFDGLTWYSVSLNYMSKKVVFCFPRNLLLFLTFTLRKNLHISMLHILICLSSLFTLFHCSVFKVQCILSNTFSVFSSYFFALNTEH